MAGITHVCGFRSIGWATQPLSLSHVERKPAWLFDFQES